MCAVCGGEEVTHNSILNARVRSINARVRFCAFSRIYRSFFVRKRGRRAGEEDNKYILRYS